MRITGGVLCGRKVAVPEGPKISAIRPAMDRMRTSVFACLGDLTGCSFLDLFSGSGIIALEAASRGADPVEAVEKDHLKRPVMLKNAAISPVRINCHFMAVELYVQRAEARPQKGLKPFDIIFCDPPFPYKYKWELVGSIAASPLMGPGSRLLIHRPREDEPLGAPPGLELEDTRIYGRSVVNFWKKTEDHIYYK